MTQEQRKDFISKIAVSFIGLIISALVFNNPNLALTNKAIFVAIIISLILLIIYFWEQLLSSSKSISSKITRRDKISALEKEKVNLTITITQLHQLSKDIITKLAELFDKLNRNNNLEDRDIAEFNEVIQKLEHLKQIAQQYDENIDLARKILDSRPDIRAEAMKRFEEMKSQDEG